MATRRSSARLSGGSEGQDGVGKNGVVNGKRRTGEGDEALGVEPEKKKRKTVAKKQPAFKPVPVTKLPSSSDTPPEQAELSINIPPPPSERKVNRRHRPVQPPSPTIGSEPPIKKNKLTASTNVPPSSIRPANPPKPSSSQPQSQPTPSSSRLPQVDFSKSTKPKLKPRPSAPRPASPPRFIPRKSMGLDQPLPGVTGFMRKTRKSMAGLGFGSDVEIRDEVVLLPDSETPMIKKNRSMREDQQRRSSMGLRGQRASTSLGRGDVSVPHTSVPDNELYKYISIEIPEAIRARHLMVWCAKRAGDAELAPANGKSKGKGKDKNVEEVRTEEGDRLIASIMEEFAANLGRGLMDTNVFAMEGESSEGMHLKPHPKNVSNREMEKKEEIVIKRCKAESTQWALLCHRTNQRYHSVLAECDQKRASDHPPEFSKAEGWMKDALGLAEGILAEGGGDLTAMGEFADVEFKVDTLLQTSHVALQYSQQAQRFLDGIFTTLTSDLRTRDRIGLEPSHTHSDQPDPSTILTSTSDPGPSRGKDPINMLRALAAVDMKVQNEDAVQAAGRLQPVGMVLGGSVGPGAAGGGGGSGGGSGLGGMTPRRAMTPRRPGTIGGLGVGTTPRRGVLSKAATPAAE